MTKINAACSQDGQDACTSDRHAHQIKENEAVESLGNRFRNADKGGAYDGGEISYQVKKNG